MTKSELKQLIKEELTKVLSESVSLGDMVKVKAKGYEHFGKTGKVVDTHKDFITVQFKTGKAIYHASDLEVK